MKCPNCGKEHPAGTKFCSECGEKLVEPVNPNGISIGDKNVVAGDIVGTKEDIHISGNATIIKNTDETKKIFTCKICGKHLTNENGHNCPVCNSFVCEDHFIKEKNCCVNCAESINESNIEKYKNVLANVYADGKVELNERKELDDLRKELGIDENTAKYLEANFNVQFNHPTNELTKIEVLSLKNAKKQLFSDFDYNAAFNAIEPLYNKHGDNEEILSLYMRIISLIKPAKFSLLYNTLNIDILEGHLSAIDLAISANNFDEAERILNKTKSIFRENNLVKAKEVEFLIEMAVYTKQNDFLSDAKNLIDKFTATSNPYEKAAFDYCKGVYALITEDEDTYQNYCKQYSKGNAEYAFFYEKRHKDKNEVHCSRCGSYKERHERLSEYCEDCGNAIEEEQRQKEAAIKEQKRLEAEAEKERKREAERKAEEARKEKQRQEELDREMDRMMVQQRLRAERRAKGWAVALSSIICVAIVIWMFLYFKVGHANIRYQFDSNGSFWGTLWHFSWVLGVVCGIGALVSGGLAAIIVKTDKGALFGAAAVAAIIDLALFAIGIVVIGVFTMPFFLAWVVWFIAEAVWIASIYVPLFADF